MSTREIAQTIILTGGTHAHGSIMCFERNALADAIDAALTKAIADEREAVWSEVLTIAKTHLDEPGFGYLLRDKLSRAAAARRDDTADTNRR
jgi:hypothetical protein